MAERIVNFSDGVQKGGVLGYIRNLTGFYRLTIVRLRNRRSDAQNRYYWGVVVPYVAAGMLEAWGEELTDDQIHFFLKSQFLAKPIIDHNTGEERGITEQASSAKLTTVEFIEYVERIAKFAAESLHVAIPEPDTDALRDAPTGGRNSRAIGLTCFRWGRHAASVQAMKPPSGIRRFSYGTARRKAHDSPQAAQGAFLLRTW
jgi:hypothetical protein